MATEKVWPGEMDFASLTREDFDDSSACKPSVTFSNWANASDEPNRNEQKNRIIACKDLNDRKPATRSSLCVSPHRNDRAISCSPHDCKRHDATSRGFVMSSGRWPEVSEPLPGFRLVLCIRKIRAIRSPVVKKCLVLASSAALAGNHAH